jgi:hypothetical protein
LWTGRDPLSLRDDLSRELLRDPLIVTNSLKSLAELVTLSGLG